MLCVILDTFRSKVKVEEDVEEDVEAPYVLPAMCYEPDSFPYACGRDGCESVFNHPSNLKKHYITFHPQYVDEYKMLYPVGLKQQCRLCLKIFNFGKDVKNRHDKTCRKKPPGQN